MAYYVTNLKVDIQQGTTNTLYATWNFDKSYLDHYVVKWHYYTSNRWFVGSESTTEYKESTYSPPSNATYVYCAVQPVSKTRKVNNVDTSYWNGGWKSSDTYGMAANPPEKPSTPTVTVDEYTLTATLSNITDVRADIILFVVYNGGLIYTSGEAKKLNGLASYSWKVAAGGKYRVRCEAINEVNGRKVYGEWSDYSSEVFTIPNPPPGIVRCKATSSTSIELNWTMSSYADTYDIEYATKKEYFDTNGQTTIVSTDENIGTYNFVGLETGETYYFRVRAVNSQGASEWTSIKYVTIGKAPAAPTTWSSTTTAIVGEDIVFYWVHNSEDGSSQVNGQIELTIDGKVETHTIVNSTDEDEKDKTSSYTLSTSKYKAGTQILWRVRTSGVTSVYGDWSVQRIVNVYAPPTLSLNIQDNDGGIIMTIHSFPFYVSAKAGPETQNPLSYHVTIVSNETYETIDYLGNSKWINSGEEIYSQFFDTPYDLLVEMTPSSVDLEDGRSYELRCQVTMSSGLTATSMFSFNVSWLESMFEPDLEIGIDTTNYTAQLRPFCLNALGEPSQDAMLSVYRREYDGRFVEIATGLDATKNIYVTDPHPALDYARYRVIATSKTTGSIGFYDPPAYPVQCKSVILQWDEAWSEFDSDIADPLEQPNWSGSYLELKYNIDVSDSNDPDVSMVEYIGRSNPVTYYGTHLGTKATWNMAIPKDDIQTLYALRRLVIWLGDVYVREPSGSGYWANVKVSFSQKHSDLTIPITLDITRVEGGI